MSYKPSNFLKRTSFLVMILCVIFFSFNEQMRNLMLILNVQQSTQAPAANDANTNLAPGNLLSSILDTLVSIRNQTEDTNTSHISTVRIANNNNNNNNSNNNPIRLDINYMFNFLKMYESKYEIRQLLQEIESNVKFTDSTSSIWNNLYSTGHSPHYYNGPYDIHKTSKHIRFPYVCHPGVVDIIFNYTFKIKEAALSRRAKRLLYDLQNHGYYGNLYTFFMHNLRHYHSPYNQPINVLFIGNSHMKQLFESTFGFIDTFNSTAVDEIVSEYIPTITPLNKTKWKASHTKYSYSELRSDSWSLYNPNDWQGDNIYHFELSSNATMRNILDADRINHNMAQCAVTPLTYVNFRDNSNSTFLMFHHQINQTLGSLYYEKAVLHDSLPRHALLESMDSNILVLNHGNDPCYDLKAYLEADLQSLNIGNKSVIFMNPWNERLNRIFVKETHSNNHRLVYSIATSGKGTRFEPPEMEPLEETVRLFESFMYAWNT